MRFSGRLAFAVAALAGASLIAVTAGPARAAGELARLYAAKPPPGSAYVRVLDLSGATGALSFDGSPAVTPAKGELATMYRIVKGGAPLVLTRDGTPVAADLVPKADSFSTVVLLPQGAAKLIVDPSEGRNDLKAQLSFYNLASGCAGSVAVKDGPTVFEGVSSFDTRQRAINPIEATLVGHCGEKASSDLKLPQLKAGDHYSLFLVEGSSGPALAGQRDETEPYQGAAN